MIEAFGGETPQPKKGPIDYFATPITGAFFFINFLFFAGGVAILTLGILSRVNPNVGIILELDKALTSTGVNIAGVMQSVATVMVLVGGTLVVIGFLGCCGTILGRSFLLYLYGIVMTLMVCMELGIFAFLYFNKQEAETKVRIQFERAITMYGANANDTDAVTNTKPAIDAFQKAFECCGADGGKDYVTSPWFKHGRKDLTLVVPASCCSTDNSECQRKPVDKDNKNTANGCVTAVLNFMYTRGEIVVGILTGIMWLQLLSVCAVACIEKAFAERDRDNQ